MSAAGATAKNVGLQWMIGVIFAISAESNTESLGGTTQHHSGTVDATGAKQILA